MSGWTARPLSSRAWLRPDSKRVQSQFSSSWSSTSKALLKEVEHLGGRNLVIERDFREEDFRLDGGIRKHAKPITPAVVVAFESKTHGDIHFECDKFYAGWRGDRIDSWQHNVRAIVLTMEALRACDRYGAVDTGQQYTGFKAIGAGSGIGLSSGMTLTDAVDVICKAAVGVAPVGPPGDLFVHEDWIKAAKIKSHPDVNNGDRTEWNQVEQAERVLRRSGKVIS